MIRRLIILLLIVGCATESVSEVCVIHERNTVFPPVVTIAYYCYTDVSEAICISKADEDTDDRTYSVEYHGTNYSCVEYCENKESCYIRD